MHDPLINTLRENIEMFTQCDIKERPFLKKIRINKNSLQIIHRVNILLNDFLNHIANLKLLNCILYAAAKTVCDSVNVSRSFGSNQKINLASPWKFRMEKDISTMRSEMTKLNNYLKTGKVQKMYKLFKKYKINIDVEEHKTSIINIVELLKQKVMAKGARLRRYNKNIKRKQSNKLFMKSESMFYRALEEGKEPTLTHTPSPEEFVKYWSNIWDESTPLKEGEWLRREENRCQSVHEMPEPNMNINDFKLILSKLSNWKAPGPDKIHNFWWKKFFNVHSILHKLINNAIKNNENISEFLAEGITYLKPKKSEPLNPGDYRPITCLNTLYKIITKVIYID